MVQILIFGLFALILGAADAQDLPANVIFHQGIQETTLEDALKEVQPGQVVVLGEEHGTAIQSGQQLQVLEALKKRGLKVSVGMEFFAYPYQAQVNAWRRGELVEADFLKAVEWGQGFSFDFYRPQVLFPSVNDEFLLALNAPRSLTSKISKGGISSLKPEDQAMMPPDFKAGNAAYFERFKKVMEGAHLPSPEALQRYFEAQSTWDDTMAWKSAQFISEHSDQVLVIIVGEFHVQYGGGLPDRLKARGLSVTTFSLVNLEGLSQKEQVEAVQPSKTDGARADFVWTSRFSRENP